VSKFGACGYPQTRRPSASGADHVLRDQLGVCE